MCKIVKHPNKENVQAIMQRWAQLFSLDIDFAP